MPPKLRPGKGARATVLTRFIKPKQPLPSGNKQHCSDVVVLGFFNDEKNRLCFTLRFDNPSHGDNDGTPTLCANRRYVHIVEEGPEEELFDEKIISWEDSHARKLLYNDLADGTIPLNGGDVAAIYASRPDFAKYDESMFRDRLEALRDIVRKALGRKRDDKLAFDRFVKNNEVSHMTHAGLPQWKDSASRKLALVDIKNRVHENLGFREMYKRHKKENKNFPFEYWRDRVKQEIGTAKYLHTLKINNGKKLILTD